MSKPEAPAFEKALVVVEWPFGAPPPTIRCPVTGDIVAAGYDPQTGAYPDGYEEPDWEQLPTLLFSYLPEVGEFSYIRPVLQDAIESKRATLDAQGKDTEDMDDFEILSSHLESIGEVPLVFEVRTRGMGHGPVSSSIYVGLDLFRPFARESGNRR